MDIKVIYNSFYDTVDPRRKKEVMDSRMIQEDHSAPSNLPLRGFQAEFKSNKIGNFPYYLDEIG